MVIYCLSLAGTLGFDLAAAIDAKIDHNARTVSSARCGRSERGISRDCEKRVRRWHATRDPIGINTFSKWRDWRRHGPRAPAGGSAPSWCAITGCWPQVTMGRSGAPHCDDVGCLLVIRDGRESCERTVHAELNAIIQCAAQRRLLPAFHHVLHGLSLRNVRKSNGASRGGAGRVLADYPDPNSIEILEAGGVRWKRRRPSISRA